MGLSRTALLCSLAAPAASSVWTSTPDDPQQRRRARAGPIEFAQHLLATATEEPRRLWELSRRGRPDILEADAQSADAQQPVFALADGGDRGADAVPVAHSSTQLVAAAGRRGGRRKLEASMEEEPPPKQAGKKKRILMLISDTGGGHRASAQAIESMFEQIAPGTAEVDIVDLFSDYGPWPYTLFVPAYQGMAKNPWMWRLSWYSSAAQPCRFLITTTTRWYTFGAVKRCIQEHDPDAVVSLHPLTQNVPLAALRKLGGGVRRLPFATIVTDLGSAHPWWFHNGVDACFVPSDRIRRAAERRGLRADQLRQYGLPVRPSFWQTPRSKSELINELGLESNRKTVLVVGGGDGVGSLGKIVEATASELSRECPGSAQVVAVCGKNAKLRTKLEGTNFGDVNVQVCGFVNQMSDYMEVADVMITKAGPGTIAEATIRGLPTMLSSFLPGQEAGNVPFVIESGFGEYSRDPKTIAKTVRGWIQDPAKLDELAKAARKAAAPRATQEIAHDILAMLELA